MNIISYKIKGSLPLKTMIKKLMPQIFLMIVLCVSSFVFYAKDTVFVKADAKQYKYTVIVDAGHPALSNTIK